MLRSLVAKLYNQNFKQKHTIILCLSPCGFPKRLIQVMITQFWEQSSTRTKAPKVDKAQDYSVLREK